MRLAQWLVSIRNALAQMKASGLYGRAGKLLRQDRALEAVGALQRSLALLGPCRDPYADPVGYSQRLTSLALLAQAAARAGDHRLAADSTREAMAFWAETKLALPQLRTNRLMVQWESWARSYTAWLESQGQH